MAMFPLNSVLVPYMPLRLRVFEERYLIMLAVTPLAGNGGGIELSASVGRRHL
jgi:Lon protease-like protein